MTPRPEATTRDGFALPAVLWLIVTVSAVSLIGTLAARDAVSTAQNRVSHRRALWRAEGCAEIVRATLGGALRDADEADRAWGALDSLIAESPDIAASDCRVLLVPSGMSLDVNGATAEQLRTLFRASGLTEPAADSLADAILDWRDDDGEARPLGAEASWYRDAERATPRNAPFTNVAELARVKGAAALEGLDTVLGVDAGHVVLSRAPAAVIAALPGFGDEAANRLFELRSRGEPPRDLLAFSGSLSPEARSILVARYAELAALVVVEPEWWTVTASASEGVNGVTAEVELRLVRAGSRAAVVRRLDR